MSFSLRVVGRFDRATSGLIVIMRIRTGGIFRTRGLRFGFRVRGIGLGGRGSRLRWRMIRLGGWTVSRIVDGLMMDI